MQSQYSKRSERHPRVRVLERDLDTQVIALVRKMRIEDEKVRDWVQSALRAKVRENQDASKERIEALRRELGSLDGPRDRLLNLWLHDEINAPTFAAKDMHLPACPHLLKSPLPAIRMFGIVAN